MLTPDGQPREDLWVEDRVHPNHAGYLIRVQLTRRCSGPRAKNCGKGSHFPVPLRPACDSSSCPSLGLRVFLTRRLARVALAGFPCLSTFT